MRQFSTLGTVRSLGFAGLYGQHRGDRLPTFFEAAEYKSRFNKPAEQGGQGRVRCSNLVPKASVRPRLLGPVTVEIAGTNHQGLRVRAIGEATAEARVNPDVDETATGSEDSECLPEDGGVVRYVGVDHDGNHTRE